MAADKNSQILLTFCQKWPIFAKSGHTFGHTRHIKVSRTWHRFSVTRLGDFCTLGNFFKPLATISLPKSLTFLGNFCKGVNIYHFSSEIIFGQLLQTFGNFLLITLTSTNSAYPDTRTFSIGDFFLFLKVANWKCDWCQLH